MYIELLSNGGYIAFNKGIARKYGRNIAIFLGEICSKFQYHKNRNELNDANEFYEDRPTIEYNTTLSSYEQNVCEQILADCIKIVKRESPPKNYYSIDEEKLEAFIRDCFEFDDIKTSATSEEYKPQFVTYKEKEVSNAKKTRQNNKVKKNDPDLILQDTLQYLCDKQGYELTDKQWDTCIRYGKYLQGKKIFSEMPYTAAISKLLSSNLTVEQECEVVDKCIIANHNGLLYTLQDTLKEKTAPNTYNNIQQNKAQLSSNKAQIKDYSYVTLEYIKSLTDYDLKALLDEVEFQTNIDKYNIAVNEYDKREQEYYKNNDKERKTY